MYKTLEVLIALSLFLVAAEWQSLDSPPSGRSDNMSIGLHSGQDIIYAADQTHKLYKSTNEGEYWDSLTYFEVTKDPICVITDPDEAWTVYLGKYHQTTPVWWSTNGGETWVERSGSEQHHITHTNPVCFVMDPNDENTVYLGCQADGGNPDMFKTTNSGVDWNALSNTPNTTVNEIAIRPNYSNTIIIATEDGLYRSTNGGADWGDPVLDKTDMTSISFSDQNYAYAGRSTATEGFYKSTNGGSDWSLVGNFLRVTTVTAVSTNEVYIVATTSSEGRGIYRTINGGTNWTYYGRQDSLFCNDSILDIIIDPDYQSNKQVYAAGDWAVYKFDADDQNPYWDEVNKGFPVDTIPRFDIKDNHIYVTGVHRRYHTQCPRLALWRSTNAGTDWRCLSGLVAEATAGYVYNEWHAVPANVNISPRDKSLFFFSGRKNDPSEASYAHDIFKSTDDGYSWTRSFNGLECCDNKNYSISISTSDPDTMFVGYAKPTTGTDIRIVRNLEEGDPEYWDVKISGIDDNSDILTIVFDPQAAEIVYAGSSESGVYKSTNCGTSWNETTLSSGEVRTLSIDPVIPGILYAGWSENSNHKIKKTTNSGSSWQNAVQGMTSTYVTDIEIDPEEPTIVYALGQTTDQSTSNHCYVTVDRAAQWFEVSDGLPNYTYDIEIDLDHPQKTYASTEIGLYTYTLDFNKHLVSSADTATFANNGRNMMRIEGTNEIWVTYESSGVIYVTYTTNAGFSWSRKMELGQGSCPAISYDPNAETPIPGVAWRYYDGDEEEYYLYFSRYTGSNEWSEPGEIVSSSSVIDPPSLAIGGGNVGHLAYTEGSTVKYTYFSITDPSPATPASVGTGHNPSIGYMVSATNPNLHIVWEYDDQIWYRSSPFGPGSPSRVSNSTTDCYHPSLAIDGNVVYFAWEADNNISWRWVVHNYPFTQWGSIKQVCSTGEITSAYPVLTSGYYCAWVEEQSGGYEVYASSYNNLTSTWDTPQNISTGTDETYSNFPHTVHKQTLQGTNVYFIWTEGYAGGAQPTAPPYEIVFTMEEFGGAEENGGDALPLYIAECGEETPSPFTIRREGYIHYGAEPYKRIDYDTQFLEYQFTHFDPDRIYTLHVYMYQRGSSNLLMTMNIDGQQFTMPNLPPDTLVMKEHILPDQLYQDGQITVTVTGTKAVSALLVLSEFEPDGKGGGPQGTEGLSGMPDCLALNVYPCPANNTFSLEYAVPMAGIVHLTLYDAAGRCVQEVSNTYTQPGIYQQQVDLTDIAQGVYFLKLESENKVITRKTVVLR